MSLGEGRWDLQDLTCPSFASLRRSRFTVRRSQQSSSNRPRPRRRGRPQSNPFAIHCREEVSYLTYPSYLTCPSFAFLQRENLTSALLCKIFGLKSPFQGAAMAIR